MELRAAIEGLKSFPSASNIVVVSDSRYLISGMTDLLLLWQARNLAIEQWPGDPEPGSLAGVDCSQ
jgi:ribonuclease HI